MPRHKSFSDRFMDKILKTEACWFWKGKKGESGYGIVYVGNGKSRMAHRVAWELFVGPIPDGLNVLHKCDTPECVNPDCLFTGTQSDNMRDMAKKGRSWSQKNYGAAVLRIAKVRKRPPVGEPHHWAKLTNEGVREIRKRRKAGQNYDAIAFALGIGKSTVGRVINSDARGGWSHVV